VSPPAASVKPGLLSQAMRLLALRGRALGRAVRDHAATLFILFPLVFGTGLLLLKRVSGDLQRHLDISANWEWLVWLVAVAVSITLCRRQPERAAIDPLDCLPVNRFVLRLDAYLTGLGRLIAVALLMAVLVSTLGGGASRWGGLGALIGLCPLLACWRRNGAAEQPLARWGVVAAMCRWLPVSLRGLVQRDLLLVLRGAVPAWGIYLALTGVSLIGVLLAALAGAEQGGTHNLGLAAAELAAWSLSGSVASLQAGQWRGMWLEHDAGVPVVWLWRAKVVVATLLGGLTGMASGVIWWMVSPLQGGGMVLLGIGVGALVGAALMEGDGEPLLHGVVALLLALAVAVLAMLSPFLLLLLPVPINYFETLALPRYRRRLDEVVNGS